MELQTKKLLVICGPTATGKTSLGFLLAKKFNGEIVSSDSRQVYKHMDIGTGKEWDDSVKIWGYDLAEPNDNYSVSEYFKSIKLVISDIWQRNKLPIIVGGTGFYIKSLIDGIATVDIPKNENLRISLEKLDINELFNKLADLDGAKAASLNSSDKRNSRRLVRAIEIAVWNTHHGTQKQIVEKRKKVLDKNVDLLMVGLSASHPRILNNIKDRVDKRINEGFVLEVENLLKIGVSWKHQSMKSLGYKESEAFFKEGLTYEEFISQWINNEMKYAKRQMTWFKKDKRINWFDINDINFHQNMVNLISKWYYLDTHDKKS
ncbi:MAG: tRNA (adenosine(37)-N6)-dimethylallyltransferase MiaA [Candidatus Woesebacteria bacterium]|nr:tRNA (adenosine(37)-N6)-dimethylallyltransferase MiaA [Candidatus Woesebacteria bacterium]